jgi:glycosyltransferase involved in cell wall biosynthesis
MGMGESFCAFLKPNYPEIDMKKTSNRSVLEYPIIVHCHLHWDWVWQRPQQFLSRLSKRHRILFVETHGPCANLSEARINIRTGLHPNVTVLQIQLPTLKGPHVDLHRRRLVKEALAGPLAGQFKRPVQWFYDPMAITAFAGHMNERAIVYDCMDELSQFRYAPPELLERERELLERADVVFTGGRKLYESKSRFNSNCYFYGCGVDVQHFNKAMNPSTPIPQDISHLEKPMLGFFGVVDERMDYDLVCKLAESNPNWNIVIIGPTAKVDANALPKAPNLHWLGGRDYQALPAYTKAFDACIMPFALNEATEYINPTKALEYMATGRPIISTPVSDVVSNFGSVVQIANSPEEFIAHCKRAIENPDPDAIKRGLKMTQENTWETIVARLEKHIDEALLKKIAENARTSTLPQKDEEIPAEAY